MKTWLIAALTWLTDALSKAWALYNLKSLNLNFECFQPVWFLGNFKLKLVLAKNTGMAWSFLEDYPSTVLLIRLVVLAIIFVWSFSRKLALSEKIALGLILGGSLGNVCDTLLYGHVVDMISVSYNSYNFPIFNVADMAICLGAIFIMFFPVRKFQLNKTVSS